MIRIESLAKSFGRNTALSEITLQLSAGQCVALIGPNGSGKTTLLKCILGLVKPSAGEVWVNGIPAAGNWSYREHIGYMPQVGRYPDQMKVRQVLELIRQIRGREAARHTDAGLISAFGLEDVMAQRMHTLSGGTRQKVSATLAFLFDPPILILDEPTAGLDPVANELLKEKIRRQCERGKLIIITSHILSDLDDVATDVLFLQEGQMQFFKSLASLKEETREDRLSRVIARIMQSNKK
ncbi:MAG: ABC transporter ATP-binding protein [Phaeodactylibacter sp.]|nr:ABC transporter ATP-binding protein [Phaeodactylibacter sp.]